MTHDFLIEAKARGFVHQCTDEAGLSAALNGGMITGYCGFDATSTSLQVGNVVALMYLRLFQKHGHRPIALMGGATTKIGDPSGKDESRPALDDATLSLHIAGIAPAFSRFLNCDANAPNGAILLNNDDWLSSLNYMDFLRTVGRHFTINRMMSFDSVRLRLEREQPLSFLEFNYMLFQAYDFMHLRTHYNCVLQLGGSDQWGNIINGVELTRKMRGHTVYGLTAPLITTSSGAKMGKTAQGAVWLNADRLSPYDYWQFWRNTHDLDVIKYLKLFTDMDLAEIARFETISGQELNDVKKILADHATTLAHGAESLPGIHAAVAALFSSGASGGEDGIEGEDGASSCPQYVVALADDQTIPVVDLCALSGLTTSKGEARRLIKGGGLRLNDAAMVEDIAVSASNFPLKLSAGKKRHVRIILG